MDGLTVLNVAQTPSAAKSMANILSRNQGLRVRDGRSRDNRIFEFNYTMCGQSCQMVFTSVTGHLMELDFVDGYRESDSCNPLDLFYAPVQKYVREDKKDIKSTLEEEAKLCQWLILWLDCDKEGENIAFEVINVCTAVNTNLVIKRARFYALIDREIHDAMRYLGRPNKCFADAMDARQEIDFRTGASFTRFQTMLLKDAFVFDRVPDDRNIIFTYDPCQFPKLGFIVERYKEIQAHQPQEFWSISCSHGSDECVAKFSWRRGQFYDKECVLVLLEMCTDQQTATVTAVRPRKTRKYPPHPLSTIELQKRASEYFQMSSEQSTQ